MLVTPMRAAVFLPSQKVFLLKKERTHPAARCFARRGGCLKWNGTLSERQALGCEDALLFALFFVRIHARMLRILPGLCCAGGDRVFLFALFFMRIYARMLRILPGLCCAAGEDAFLFALFFVRIHAGMLRILPGLCCAAGDRALLFAMFFMRIYARMLRILPGLCCAGAIELCSSLCFLCASMRECFAFSRVFAALGAMRHSFHCGCAQHTQPLATISRLRASVSSGTICSASPTMP